MITDRMTTAMTAITRPTKNSPMPPGVPPAPARSRGDGVVTRQRIAKAGGRPPASVRYFFRPEYSSI